METAIVLIGIVLFTLALYGFAKLTASKGSPTAATSTTNPVTAPTSEEEVIVQDVETDVKGAVADVKKDL